MFNDDTPPPGAVRPLHPHREAEVWSLVLEARQRIEHPPTPGHVRGAMLFRVRSGRVAEMRAYVKG